MMGYTQLAMLSLALGASVGLLASAAWLRMLPTASPHVHTLTLVGCTLLVPSLRLLARTYRATRADVLLVGAMGLAAAAAFTALRTTGTALAVMHASAPALLYAGLVTFVLLFAPVSRASRVGITLVLLVAAVPAARDLSALSGAPLARSAMQYAPPDLPRHLYQVVSPLALLGALAGLMWAWFTRSAPATSVTRGAMAGALVGVPIYASHVTACFATMSAGQSPLPVALSVVFSWAVIAVTFALAMSARRDPGASYILRLGPMIAVALIGVDIASVAYGTSDYCLLNRLHPDAAYAYIHLRSDGTRQRSLDQDGNTARLWRCERFLDLYPRSAYRPAVMLTQAQCLFELWRFQEAQAVLRQMRSSYPALQGFPEVLDALAAIAAGAPRHYLRPVPSDGFLASWRRTQGALIAASAAESLALPYRALGYHAAYEQYLQSASPAAWTASSAGYANLQSDRIVEAIKKGSSVGGSGSVTVTLTANDRPVGGVRVVLVQPHPDAALPTDSAQFTGAWTLPAWNGRWATTDHDGRARMRGVPFGSYELVIGLPSRSDLRGLVLSASPSSVCVDRRSVSLPTLRLVPAVQLVAPKPSAQVSPRPGLAWREYRGASHYSVCIIAADRSPRSAASVRLTRPGETCWTRASIPTNSVAVDPRHFVNGRTSLEPGGTYMWVVYAYGSSGELLSSSEHYYDLQESSFTVAAGSSEQTKGGTLQ